MYLYIYSRKWRLHRKHDSKSQKHLEESLPGVSILKPLCTSDDPYLFSNLETFFKLSYPGKVFLFECDLKMQILNEFDCDELFFIIDIRMLLYFSMK